MATQAERTASARRRLIDAASHLVAERGIGGTSVAEIGDAAGMSRGAVNFHFGSKDELLTAVTEFAIEQWTSNVQRADPELDQDLGPLLDKLVDDHLRRIHEQPVVSRLIMVLLFEALGPAPHLRPLLERLLKGIAGVAESFIVGLQAQGKVRADVDSAAFATFLIGSLRGLALLGLLEPGIDQRPGPYDELAAAARAYLEP